MPSRSRLIVGAAVVAAVLVLAYIATTWASRDSSGAAVGQPSATPSPATPGTGVTVSGNRLVDSAGQTVILHGVNRSGSEYACIDGWGFFDGPADQASLDAMKRWGINTVRVPLNSACWLDIREQFATYNEAYAGQAYQDAIATFVDLITTNGMYTVLDLQWTGCGDATCLANEIKPMPERGNATEFWSSVAGRFKANDSVLFDLFNEPRDVDWACWKSGGCTVGDPAFTAEGMQPMVDAVRAAGATTQPIMLGGLSYANDMTGWAANLPSDPSNGLVASIHLYNFSAPCPTSVGGTAADAITCFTDPGRNSIDAIAAAHPVVFGELGQDNCATDFVDPILTWIGERGYSVLGWAWNTADCAKFPALITAYDGTPTAFGTAFQKFFAATATPTPTPSATTSPASNGGAANPIISRGRPAFASVGAAGNANDGDFTTWWGVPAGETAWLAYDLSGVPAEDRRAVVLAWYTAPDDGFTTAGIQGGCPIWSGRPFLGDYVVEVNAAEGGGDPPTSGWREVDTVSGNVNLSAQHKVNFSGSNWIRISGGGPNGVAVNVDVADASSGDSGGWLFTGDSITATYGGHALLAGPGGAAVPGIGALIAAGSQDRFQPLVQNNGVPCSKSGDALVWIDEMLEGFHGRYVTLNYGGNDGYGGQGGEAGLKAYYEHMEDLIAKVTDLGMVPVIPTITWPNNPGAWDRQIQKLNDQIRRLYKAHPEVIPGPDLYTLLKGRTELYRGAGDVHLNDQGSALIREAWAETLLGTVYEE